MKHKSRWILLSSMLAACGTSSAPPAPPLPDGTHRRPVNTAEHIERYRDRLSSEAAEKIRAPGERRRVDILELQIAGLRETLTTLADTERHAGDTPAAQHGMAPATRTPAADGLAPNEAVQFLPRAIVFKVPFAVAGTGFNPSAAMRLLLVRAAGDSPRIELRGRTDADSDSAADRALALRRAAAAREFLMRHGISANRIHATALASGGHAADNATAAGKARNRRVDIEVMDIDPLIYRMEVQTTEGEPHEPD